MTGTESVHVCVTGGTQVQGLDALRLTSCQQHVYELMATLELIRADILDVLDGNHVAHPDVIRALLYPEEPQIAALAETLAVQARNQERLKDGKANGHHHD
jgi:hypothetical protein